jgi:hypothetical protein
MKTTGGFSKKHRWFSLKPPEVLNKTKLGFLIPPG